MNKMNKIAKTSLSFITLIMLAQQAHAAIALDRTRVVFEGDKSSMSVSITNQNKSLPYLAQSWVEDSNGNKIESPLTALPPLQRVEPGAKGQVKIQATGNLASLPQDRESLFYFNVREIPPKSDKPNTLQLALQTRVKMFYRPAVLTLSRGDENEAQKKLTLTRQGDGYVLNNPTPYYVTIVGAAASAKGNDVSGFKPMMIAPKGNLTLGGSASALGAHPVLTFVNDFGGRPLLTFNCSGSSCTVANVKAG
ncbi:molecular chaperone [Citrobacter sp. NCU1]|uniref:fimbria/pilus periplasmic chaperone n=1 Tax=Citrobacter sp. NCU1 TaxID=2026683 RepID=UPI00139103FC|nr:molecular chaperone [Citrobacter sp. NCU1]